MRHAAALIVGGGPAGAAAAIALARSGVRPLVLERTAEPQDALCGGFLSWNTAALLDRLGVSPAQLGAFPIRRVALFAGKRTATARLPKSGYALSRRTLDAALLARAEACGAEVVRGAHVRELTDRAARLADGSEASGEALILATGKHDLRGIGRPHETTDPTMGFRWRLAASPDLHALVSDAVELHLLDGGYAGIARQEDGSVNLCMAVRRSALQDAGNSPDALLAALAGGHPHLGHRLAAASAPLPPADAVANVPYGWVLPERPAPWFRVGDQAAVIPSLAGEGIAIALASGRAAAETILAGEGTRVHATGLRHRARGPVRLAQLLWHTAERPRLAAPLVTLARLCPSAVRQAAAASRMNA